MIITIDGPAAAGKGTLASKLASKYNLTYFDTGMVYRAVGLDVVLQGKNPNDEQAALSVAQKLTFPRIMELSKHRDFRSALGGDAASKVSAIPSVRAALLQMQRDFALNPQFSDGRKASGVVYDGRDAGTVICPQADVKVFITASSEVRAMRRFKEFQQKGLTITYEEVLAQTKERDERDASRSSAPMKPANDAVIIDTSDMSIDEVYEKVCNIVESRQKTLEK
ncbi:MAG: (d)CMP kinase [Alphaproteobacteria bacterium]|nr:(d)CMP kinase [Alphaproteobacteria bacterium]